MSLKTELEHLKADLATQRDEIKVKMSEAKKELQAEWHHAEEKTEQFFAAAGELAHDAKEELVDGVKLLGEDLKKTYEKIKSHLV